MAGVKGLHQSHKTHCPRPFSVTELRFFHLCKIGNREYGLLFRVLRLEPDVTFTVVDLIKMNG